MIALFGQGQSRAAAPVLAVLLMLVFASSALGSDLEYRVKAAFLYNFTKFVDWPDEVLQSADTVTICVVGEDPFGSSLDTTIRGKTTGSRTLSARRIRQPEEVGDCRVLYVGYSDSAKLQNWVSLARAESVLTVGDYPRFVEAGGIIEFVIVDGKVRFDINNEAARRSRLRMSSKLLRLARTVVQ